jgi:hypothetical protein
VIGVGIQPDLAHVLLLTAVPESRRATRMRLRLLTPPVAEVRVVFDSRRLTSRSLSGRGDEGTVPGLSGEIGVHPLVRAAVGLALGVALGIAAGLLSPRRTER